MRRRLRKWTEGVITGKQSTSESSVAKYRWLRPFFSSFITWFRNWNRPNVEVNRSLCSPNRNVVSFRRLHNFSQKHTVARRRCILERMKRKWPTNISMFFRLKVMYNQNNRRSVSWFKCKECENVRGWRAEMKSRDQPCNMASLTTVPWPVVNLWHSPRWHFMLCLLLTGPVWTSDSRRLPDSGGLLYAYLKTVKSNIKVHSFWKFSIIEY